MADPVQVLQRDDALVDLHVRAALDGSVVYETSDGDIFQDEQRALVHQAAIDGTLASPTPLPSIPAASQISWLGGEGFVISDVPAGDVELAYDAPSDREVWRISLVTWEALNLMPPSTRVAKVTEMRRAREGGKTVVSGVVKADVRRGTATRQKPATLQPLLDRAKGLVITIASLDAPTDGQVSEITKTVAALQAERDALAEQLAEIDEHLSIGRAVMIAHSDPRAAVAS